MESCRNRSKLINSPDVPFRNDTHDISQPVRRLYLVSLKAKTGAPSLCGAKGWKLIMCPLSFFVRSAALRAGPSTTLRAEWNDFFLFVRALPCPVTDCGVPARLNCHVRI